MADDAYNLVCRCSQMCLLHSLSVIVVARRRTQLICAVLLFSVSFQATAKWSFEVVVMWAQFSQHSFEVAVMCTQFDVHHDVFLFQSSGCLLCHGSGEVFAPICFAFPELFDHGHR